MNQKTVPLTMMVKDVKVVIGEAEVREVDGTFIGTITRCDPAAADLLKAEVVNGMSFSIPMQEGYREWSKTHEWE
jgi:hypothetical protein